MFDTMTMTKIVGGVCGTLLFFLFGNWAAGAIYGLGEEGHGEEKTYAYQIEVEGGEAAATDEGAAVEVAYADVAATADANATGPHLNGVVGRARGSIADFKYSETMASVHDAWTPENLYAFLKNPKEYVAGTKMGFAGLAKPEDRANVIAYLSSLK